MTEPDITAALDRLEAAEQARPRDEAELAAAAEAAVRLVRAHPEAGELAPLDELLDTLAETYEALGRIDDALAAMREAIDAGWEGRPEGRCRLAEILTRAGRLAEAAPLWEQSRAAAPDDIWVYNNAGLEYAMAGEHTTAVSWLTPGLELALSAGDPQRLTGQLHQLHQLRQESLTALGLPGDELQARAEGHLTARQARAGIERSRTGQAAVLAFGWFPFGEFDAALARWPELADRWGADTHTAYCRAQETHMSEVARAGGTRIRLVPIRVGAYEAWCAGHGEDPATSQARAAYAAETARTSTAELIVWPPARNNPCWCGSGTKYKKCCAAPPARKASR